MVSTEESKMNEQMNSLFIQLDAASNIEEIKAIQEGFAAIGWVFLGTRENYRLTPIVSESSESVEL